MATENTYTIDAKGKRMGRVATEAATMLMGKHETAFERHNDTNLVVTVTGVDSMDVSEKKRSQEVYKRYSGHPGGQTVEPMHKVIEKKGMSEVLRIAVKGMLPANKLRPGRMKRLVIEG